MMSPVQVVRLRKAQPHHLGWIVHMTGETITPPLLLAPSKLRIAKYSAFTTKIVLFT